MIAFYIAGYLAVLLFYRNYVGADSTDFIVGGTEATEGEFPYQVVIERNGKPDFTGSLISHRWILTAANLLQSNNSLDFTVKLGVIDKTSDVESIPIEKIVLHENYKDRGAQYPIALLKMKHCVHFNTTIRPVVLHQKEIQVGTVAILSGYGATDIDNEEQTNMLHKVTITTISNKECGIYYLHIKQSNTSNTICSEPVRGIGGCPEDGGGPLVLSDNKEQIGLLVGGIPCGRKEPSVYLAVYPFLDWIKLHTID